MPPSRSAASRSVHRAPTGAPGVDIAYRLRLPSKARGQRLFIWSVLAVHLLLNMSLSESSLAAYSKPCFIFSFSFLGRLFTLVKASLFLYDVCVVVVTVACMAVFITSFIVIILIVVGMADFIFVVVIDSIIVLHLL